MTTEAAERSGTAEQPQGAPLAADPPYGNTGGKFTLCLRGSGDRHSIVLRSWKKSVGIWPRLRTSGIGCTALRSAYGLAQLHPSLARQGPAIVRSVRSST